MVADLRERAISAWEAALRAAAEREVRSIDPTAVVVALDLRSGIVDFDGVDKSWRFHSYGLGAGWVGDATRCAN
jgi:hypothetical protein